MSATNPPLHPPLSTDGYKLIAALLEGPVSAIGGLIYSKSYGKPLFTAIALSEAIDELDHHGLRVRRQDAGGSPRWDVERDTTR